MYVKQTLFESVADSKILFRVGLYEAITTLRSVYNMKFMASDVILIFRSFLLIFIDHTILKLTPESWRFLRSAPETSN